MQTSTKNFNVYQTKLLTDIIDQKNTSTIYEIIEEENGFAYNNRTYLDLEKAYKDCETLNNKGEIK